MEASPLHDLPTGVLGRIFSYFDDQTFLKAALVCKRFKSVAESAVATKYNGKCERNWYQIEEFVGDDYDNRMQYQPFLDVFGSQISAYKIVIMPIYERETHWTIEMIRPFYCTILQFNLEAAQYDPKTVNVENTHVRIDLDNFIPNLLNLKYLCLKNIDMISSRWVEHHYPHLTSILAICVLGFEPDNIRRFLDANPRTQFITSQGKFVEDHCGRKALVCNMERRSSNMIGRFHSLTFPQKTPPTRMSTDDFEQLFEIKELKQLDLLGVILNAEQIQKLFAGFLSLKKLVIRTGDDLTIDDLKSILAETKNHPNLNYIRIESNVNHELILKFEFHKWFVAFAKPNLKCLLGENCNGRTKHMVFINQDVLVKKRIENICINNKITLNTLHWIECSSLTEPSEASEPTESSEQSFLALDDKCLEKIVGYLDLGNKLALYQTCNKMKKVIEPILQRNYAQDNLFEIRSDLYTQNEDFLRYIGKSVTKIYFNLSIRSQQVPPSTIWNLIHKYCHNSLTELIVYGAQPADVQYLDQNGLVFLNLEKLEFRLSILTIYDGLSFNYSFCPNLMDLKFNYTTLLNEPINFELGIAFEKLTKFRCERFNYAVKNFLKILDVKTCQRIDELTLMNVHDTKPNTVFNILEGFDNSVVMAIAKFSNLVKLNVVFDGIERINHRFLFENCSNLKELSIYYDGRRSSTHLYSMPSMVNVKKICQKLEKLQIVTIRCGTNTYFQFLKNLNILFRHIPIVEVIELNKHFNDANSNVNSFLLIDEWLANWNKRSLVSLVK